MASLLARGLDRINSLTYTLLFLMLAAMVAIVFWQVAVRFALPPLGIIVSAPWTEEAARYLMIWSIFLGGSVAASKGLLIAVNALIDALPAHAARYTRLLALSCTIAFLAVLTWYGWVWSEFGAVETSPVLTISKRWLYLAMPVGTALMLLNLLSVLIRIALQPARQAESHQ
ncbi:TRAP transporter small permease [Paracandidimonas soli]|uniref:TRAP transporter small permease protein n=1 Tax=Paracandidimonas soli TaxID=1917182 RepID=A0A4R3V6Y0_9BURK|nr:TRAP transporter small permease [Paracandidimonas soli]TCU99147.1 TRAP-type C4-dicarboxylate transport system permease small subunit [Paracandidimonas soli]